MSDAASERRLTAMQVIRTYWMQLVFLATAASVLATVWMDLAYVRQVVNPNAMVEYARDQERDRIRWCLIKLVNDQSISSVKMLGCAD